MQLLEQLKSLIEDPKLILAEEVQSLWSGYGQIIRCYSPKNNTPYIVKVIAPQSASSHPRGWNTSVGHQRKLTSYQVESSFYQYYAHLTDGACKVPLLIASKTSEEVTLLVMEDLDNNGFDQRKDRANWQSLSVAIRWLAYFHAKFMGSPKDKLWAHGTYWHLSTRQDELNAMPDSDYKQYARGIDQVLNNARFQTLVHGDAKFENLCFHRNGHDVAAVDFQYIGQGSGVKDLAYLAGSCLDNEGLNEFGDAIIDEYITQLKQALVHYKINLDFDALEQETRELYPVAWADFYRFLLGWNPESWKICDYMKQLSQKGLEQLKGIEYK